MTAKTYKGEKYIYLLMGYMLAKDKLAGTKVGNDNGYVSAYNYERTFAVREYQGETILTERKGSAGGADFTRTFVVVGNLPRPTIRDYVSGGDNYGQQWVH